MMRFALDNLAFLDHEDLISFHDIAQSMRNHECGTTVAKAAEGSLDLLFDGGVDGRCGFDKYGFRIFEQDA